MSDPVIPWALAAAAAALAVIFGWQARASRASRETTERERARLQTELDRASKKSDDRSDALARKNEEIEELRRKLGKAKKRAVRAHEEKASEAGRQESLEEQLEMAQQAAQAARADAEAARAELAKVSGKKPPRRATREDGAATAREGHERPPRERTPDELDAEREKTAAAELQAVELRKALASSEHELKRARGRAETNHRVYLVTKGELEAARDKLRTLERRLGTASFREMLGGAKAAAIPPPEPSLESDDDESADEAGADSEPEAGAAPA